MTCQAMRVIINDKRYGALKAHGERKQAFNEVNPLINNSCVYNVCKRCLSYLYSFLPSFYAIIVFDAKKEVRG